MKDIQELLEPRMIVEKDYPNSPFKIGEIICLPSNTQTEWANRYPHIFRWLKWWEYLKPVQLPKYVKWDHGGILEVINWRSNHNTGQLDGIYTNEGAFLFIEHLLPATEQEYNDYL